MIEFTAVTEIKEARMRIFNFLANKRLIWTTYVRVFTDGGCPLINYIPRIHRVGYARYWGLRGFYINWLGRQVFFSFGEDRKGLYQLQEGAHRDGRHDLKQGGRNNVPVDHDVGGARK